MRLFRPRPTLVVEVALHQASRASVRIAAGAKGAPGPEPAAAARAALAAVALAAHRVAGARRDGLDECLVGVSQALAALGGDDAPERLVHLGPLGVADFLMLEPWGTEPVRGRVALEIVVARGGRWVPRPAELPDFAGPSLEIAALAAVQRAGAPRADADLRLALALGVEGVIAWYRQADRMSPPHDALAFALAHAAERLGESGREAPAGFA